MTTPEQIAKGLHRQTKDALSSSPDHIEGRISALIDLCLSGLAECKPDGTLVFTPLGLAVREVLMKEI